MALIGDKELTRDKRLYIFEHINLNRFATLYLKNCSNRSSISHKVTYDGERLLGGVLYCTSIKGKRLLKKGGAKSSYYRSMLRVCE